MGSFKVGDRVRFEKEYDVYPWGSIKVGTTGVISDVSDEFTSVTLDEPDERFEDSKIFFDAEFYDFAPDYLAKEGPLCVLVRDAEGSVAWTMFSEDAWLIREQAELAGPMATVLSAAEARQYMEDLVDDSVYALVDLSEDSVGKVDSTYDTLLDAMEEAETWKAQGVPHLVRLHTHEDSLKALVKDLERDPSDIYGDALSKCKSASEWVGSLIDEIPNDGWCDLRWSEARRHTEQTIKAIKALRDDNFERLVSNLSFMLDRGEVADLTLEDLRALRGQLWRFETAVSAGYPSVEGFKSLRGV